MRRSLLLAATLLAVVGCGQPAVSTSTPASSPAVSPAASESSSPSGVASGTPITVKDFTLDPKDVTQRGRVSLAVTNQGPTIHNVTIRDASGAVVGATPDLKEGASATLEADLPAGTYVLYCSLPGHESLGIKGTLVVQR